MSTPVQDPRLLPAQAIRVVATREISVRVRSKAFFAITAVLVLAVVSTVLLFHFIDRSAAADVKKVGLTPDTAQFRDVLVAAGAAAGQPIETVLVDMDAGEQRLRADDLSAVLVGLSDGQLQVVVKSALPDGLRTTFGLAARQAALHREIAWLGGDPAAVDSAIADAKVAVRPLRPAADHDGARVGMAAVIGVLTYVMLLISIQLTGQGVVEEKANRIVELLLATVRPWELLAGKVIGIGIVTIIQVAVIAAAGAIAAVTTGVLRLSTAMVGSVVGWAVLWYLLGYFLYALVVAAAASLVSRQEDLASVAVPVSVVLIAAYLIGQTVVSSDPHGTSSTVLSMIPLFSPVVMPMRAAYEVPGWQMATALVVMVATIALVARSAGQIYGKAVLLTGSRVSLRTALSTRA
ncbi:ABC-2 type transport system permease protein [Nocardia tenerifensis]|uniref:ABC-2 type transport system permease protein n=1 Tax=Nocardia tenerifensis TaxID=228006 RepID=A0A318KA47_9NOCA|nr:ABC transporter permease [Nocardia tenerifensis]PXX66866.1 ABC-2 type transport system permease protein [Nocardia tenerifensis]